MPAFPEVSKIKYEGPQSKHPLAFRFDGEDRAAYRGTLTEWAEHFVESLRMLTAWFGGEE